MGVQGREEEREQVRTCSDLLNLSASLRPCELSVYSRWALHLKRVYNEGEASGRTWRLGRGGCYRYREVAEREEEKTEGLLLGHRQGKRVFQGWGVDKIECHH